MLMEKCLETFSIYTLHFLSICHTIDVLVHIMDYLEYHFFNLYIVPIGYKVYVFPPNVHTSLEIGKISDGNFVRLQGIYLFMLT